MIGFFNSCEDDDNTAINNLPNTVTINETSLHAEGIVYNPKDGKIYMGSYYKGKIVSVDMAGNIKDFAHAPELVAPTGLAIDEQNNWLVVCNADAGISQKSSASTTTQLAQLVIFDLSTGEKVKTIDLNPNNEPGRFANDLVIDNDGNMYVTESIRPSIYKVDAAGNVSVFATDDRFAPFPQTFGLNGIVLHPDGYLIVGKADEGKLFKIPLNAPDNITEIALDGMVNSIDGLLLKEDGSLYLVSNYFGGPFFNEAVYKISSTDNWTSASITNTMVTTNGITPTTMANVEGTIYVNYANFLALITGSDPVPSFLLEKVEF